MSAQVLAVCRTACSMPVWGCWQNPDPGFRQYSAELLQQFDKSPAVSSECRSTSHHRSQTVRSHHASPTSAALAASPQMSGFQDIHLSLLFVGWHRSCVPSWRMYAGYCRWPPSSAVCWQSNVLGQEITQPVHWPLFCHRRANAVEQSARTASATGHHLRTIQTIVENVYVWLVGLRRPVSGR